MAAPLQASSQEDTPSAPRQRQGPTGLDVSGARPTSPKGWNTMMQALKDANVSAWQGGGHTLGWMPM